MRRDFSGSTPSGFLVCVCALVLASFNGLGAEQQPSPGAAPASGEQAPKPPVQAAPASHAPFPNRANEVMPSWLRIRGEFRERAEGFSNAGFVDERDDAYFLTRVRLTATVSHRAIAATVQAQDARVGAKSVGPTGAPFAAAFDLRQAVVEIRGANVPLTARLGRQEIAFGDQRLVGHANWLNSGRTFDAARVTVGWKAARVDVFAASVVHILDGELDKSGNGNLFAGAYLSSIRILPAATAEPYIFWRRDISQRAESGVLGTLDQVTGGARVVGRLPARLDYTVEMDVQRGSLGADPVRAWAGHWQVRSTPSLAGTPRVAAEYNYASGDTNPADGIRGTFDQLYPTAHDKYGLADQVGWRNIHHLRIGTEVTPIKSTSLAVNYHSYWLAEPHDALYAASGAVLARVPSGAAHAHVGQEIDVQVTRPFTSYLALNAGYAHLFSGAFLREATPGKSYSGPFVMVTYVFLAER